jgi:hypothetical protein
LSWCPRHFLIVSHSETSRENHIRNTGNACSAPVAEKQTCFRGVEIITKPAAADAARSRRGHAPGGSGWLARSWPMLHECVAERGERRDRGRKRDLRIHTHEL